MSSRLHLSNSLLVTIHRVSAAAAAIITLPLSEVPGPLLSIVCWCLADVSPPRCDDFLLPWDVYGLHKGQVLKRL